MRRLLYICYITTLLLAGNCCYSLAQTKVDSVKNGSLKGIIKDSKRGFPLISATVSVYKLKTAELVKYGLTNTYGYFTLTEIPTSDSLKLIISYIGYKARIVKFKIDVPGQLLDLKEITVEAGAIDLREVAITSNPPIKIKGDTIEFSADAFKLQPNAVAEDLLRKLPGVIIWGDGKITVNGKNVSQVLVDGKIFFGGNFKLATQNLPKSVIDKVQITPDKPTESNPVVSTVSLNLTLKEDRKKGLFGKLSAGVGSEDRYDNNASLNSFKPDLQVSVAGSLNNVNKIATDINMLLEDAVFKPSRANEYLPNFNDIGINKFSSGGMLLSKTITGEKKLDIGFLSNKTRSKVDQDYLAVSVLSDSNLIDGIVTKRSGLQQMNDLTGAYTFDNSKKVFRLNSQFTRKVYSSEESRQNTISSSNNPFLSSSNRVDHSNAINNTISVAMELDNPADLTGEKYKERSYYIKYKLNYADGKEDAARRGNYNIQNSAEIDRKYIRNRSEVNNSLELRYRNIGRFIDLKSFQIDLVNKFELNHYSKGNHISDSENGNFIENKYVSNRNNFWMTDEKPAISLKKRFKKFLNNRYSKDLLITANLQGHFASQRNSAMINSQDFSRDYAAFIPNIQSVYQYNNVGRFNRTIKIGYNSNLMIPEPDEIVSVPDSSDIYYLRVGNYGLKPAFKHEVSISFYQSSANPKENYIASFDFKAGLIKDVVIDSINYGNVSSGITYASTNGDISKYMSVLGSISRTYTSNEQQFMPSLFMGFNVSTIPRYLNQQLYETRNMSVNLNATFSYTFKNLFLLSIDHGMRFFRNKQLHDNYSLNTSLSNISTVNFTLNQFRRFTYNANVKNSYSKISSGKNVNFMLLNSSVLYRFLKSEQLEVKFSALDILRQNKNVIIDQFENRVSRSEINSLQQYFMLSASYFPRVFNKSK